ncbi:MAG: hypothetical protein ACRC7G_14085 [Beijerinckiaceae bacterium]
MGMTIRTRETTVTFAHPFSLGGVDQPQPAGTYRVVSDDEEVPGISFVALRRVATFLHTPALSIQGSIRTEVFEVGASELAAALDDDERAARRGNVNWPAS